MRFISMVFCGIASILALSACAEKETTAPGCGEFIVIPSINAYKSPVMAPDGKGSFSAGDTVTLIMKSRYLNKPTSQDYVCAKRYLWKEIGYPQYADEFYIHGCYPAVDTDISSVLLWNIVEHADNPDFLISRPVMVKTDSSEPIIMEMSHALHSLRINIICPDNTISAEAISKAEVTLSGVSPTAIIDLVAADVHPSYDDTLSVHATGKSADFIIPYQSAYFLKISAKIDGKTYILKPSEYVLEDMSYPTQLRDGYRTSMTMKISTVRPLNAEVTTEPWH